MTAAILVGIGQLAAGDDGVGLAVARELAARGLAVRESADASLLLALLEAGHRVVLVDAVASGGPPGTVMQLHPDALGAGPTPLSSHGLSVAEAIALARTLYGDAVIARLAIVGIAIERPAAHAVGLSPAVAAAVGPAAELAAVLIRDPAPRAALPAQPGGAERRPSDRSPLSAPAGRGRSGYTHRG